MSKIVVLGGGMIGLSTAMLLSRQGHNVTVFERDDAPLPDSADTAWQQWRRRGVAQFRQPHYLHSAARLILDAHLPHLKQALLQAGCIPFDLMSLLPESIADRNRRPDDGRFVTVTGRRPTLEYAVARAAEGHVAVIRGQAVVSLAIARAAHVGIPHVSGVRLTDDSEFSADLVIDASGRYSKLPAWLRAIGSRGPIEEAEESGFKYYTRFFRARSATVPQFRSGMVTHFPLFSLLILPGDANTWSVTIFTLAGEPALRSLRDPARWSAIVAACPMQAHWLDGEPITDVLTMGGVTDRYRRFVVNGLPVATGVLAVGDALACTNPIGGRGMTVGLMNALGTAEVVARHIDDPLALALAHDAMTEARVAPWYRFTVAFDRARTAEIRAVRQGQPVPRRKGIDAALEVAMLHDPVLFRAYLEVFSMLATPREVLSRPGIVERIIAGADVHEAPTPEGPSRAELLRILG